ncbi:hypothetical protein [Dictyobacter kobayashii]|uniref:hypothetical protein n=1 Tax=Dictyobacter kobayashii TaxID=2014872 RepID=UPI001FE60168|nr:hypothetical protein [Dictyobacter kobayashii]
MVAVLGGAHGASLRVGRSGPVAVVQVAIFELVVILVQHLVARAPLVEQPALAGLVELQGVDSPIQGQQRRVQAGSIFETAFAIGGEVGLEARWQI